MRTLRVDDLDFANRVRAQAGWNQTLDDWRRFLALEPEGCFLAELDGVPVGTATTTVYGNNDLAWIGMVLVDESARRKGVGTALLEHAIAYLRDQRQVGCIKLDATPAGQPLYEKLGFVAEWGLQRWQLMASGGSGDLPSFDADEAVGRLECVLDLDRRVFGADRSALLRSLARGAWSVQTCEKGYAILRTGSRASYLGPVVAPGWGDAEPLVTALLREAPAGPVFWDIPDHSHRAHEFAQSAGFEPQRQLVRMALGGATIPETLESVFGIAEPALG